VIEAVLDALRVVQDPDLRQDIVALGFIHGLVVEDGAVRFELRLTTPACPVKDQLRDAARAAALGVPGVLSVEVTLGARAVGRVVSTVPALRGVRNIVAIGAGKGGVGKSTTAVQLAWALAAQGARVALLDADIYGPSLVHLTGAGEPEALGEGLMRPAEVDGIAVVSLAQFVPASRATILRGPRISSLLQQLLTTFEWGERDYLLVDLPPGTGDVPLTLAQLVPLTGAVLVTTPQEVAVLDARRAIHLFRTLDVPLLGVVETMSGFACPCCGTVTPIFAEGGADRLAAEAGVPVLGRVPLDPAVVQGGERGRPGEVASSAGGAAWRAAAGQLAAALSILHAGRGEGVDSFDLDWADATSVALALGDDRPVALARHDERTLSLRWADGVEARVDAVALRRACPCAACVDENTGRRTLAPEAVADDVRPTRLRSSGRYALAIGFTDGHDTGLYTWRSLRGLAG
jgi:ATP-binding protein involved in chromosome partitioning